MPNIAPFRGIHYDPVRTYGLSPVIGPPEDLPDLAQAARLMEGRPYHSLRLELGHRDLAGADPSENVREQVLEAWLAFGILVRTESPALFVHEHRYRQDGVYHRRLGLFVAAEIGDDPETGFLRHEGTIEENLRYRSDILQRIQLSITPILTIIRDNGELGEVLANLVHARPPDLSGHDVDEGVHRVWITRDPELTRWLQHFVAERPLYIADGHHRFEAAKACRDHYVRQGLDPGPAGSVLTLIVSESGPGLSILPTHREVLHLSRDWRQIEERLDKLFDVTYSMAAGTINPEAVRRRVQELNESRGLLPEFLLLRHEDQQLFRARLRSWELIEDLLDDSLAEGVRRLDATVLHRVLLEDVLGIPPNEQDAVVEYSADAETVVQRVQSGDVALGLFMRGPSIEEVLAVADAGANMPQKSTYFYPKVPAGLVMYDLR